MAKNKLRLPVRFLFFPVTVLVFLLSCDNPVQWPDDPEEATQVEKHSTVDTYSSEHFHFFFDDTGYTISEIMTNASIKERHLTRIEETLNENFNGKIAVRFVTEELFRWSGTASAQKPYLITETRNYFNRDNGHEVAHVVSYATLGYHNHSFFVEGLAVYLENPRGQRTCNFPSESTEFLEFLKENQNAESSGDVDYLIAGAYTKWLIDTFGMEKYKMFYRRMHENEQGYASTSKSLLFSLSFRKELRDSNRIFYQEIIKNHSLCRF